MATVRRLSLAGTGSASLPITNLTGHPAVCLKNGFVDGLPQALMITGPAVRRGDACSASPSPTSARRNGTLCIPTLDEESERRREDTEAADRVRAGRRRPDPPDPSAAGAALDRRLLDVIQLRESLFR